VVVRAEIEQHGFLQPLVDDPLAVFLLGDTRLAGVEKAYSVFHGAQQRGVDGGGRDFRAALEGRIDGGLQCAHVGRNGADARSLRPAPRADK
jgi:hypothetical protein